MKLILKKDVESLGEAGDMVKVADGYGRNYLLPQGYAELATDGALRNRDKNIARIKAKAEKLHQEAVDKSNIIQSLEVITLQAKAGENDKLFGAITTKKLSEELQERTGVDVDRRNISLDNPINRLGEYKMKVKLSSKVEVVLPINVVASEVIIEETTVVGEKAVVEAAEIVEE